MANIERDFSERARTTALTALEVVPFAMLIVDPAAEALAVNSRWLDLSHLGHANSMGPGWLSALDPDSRARLQDTIARVAAEGGMGTVDLQLHSGPRPRWVRWWASRHEVDDSSLIAVAAADIDADYTRQANLYHQATHDALTGLVNRSHFMECTDQALRRSSRQQRHVAVVYVDLDDFKRVNDRGGHSLGDRVLYAIAARLRHAVRAADMVARIGGDEFAVLCEGLTQGDQAEVVARRIASALTESVELDGQRWPVAASVGIAIDQGEIEAAETLVDRADQAMYSVKMTNRPSGVRATGPTAPQTERRRMSDSPIVDSPIPTPSGSGPSPASPWPSRSSDRSSDRPGGLDADEARRALRELVDAASNWSQAPGSRRTAGDTSPGRYPDAAGYTDSGDGADAADRTDIAGRGETAGYADRGGHTEAAVYREAPPTDRGARAEDRRVSGDARVSDDGGQAAGGSAPSGDRSASGADLTGTTATMSPPAPTPTAVGSRERLATDVMTLRDSIDSIRMMLDRLLRQDLGGSGVIDIRE